MLLVDEWLATLVSLSTLLHGILDLFVLPDAFRSVVEDCALNNVAAQLQVFLRCAIGNLADHVFVLSDEL